MNRYKAKNAFERLAEAYLIVSGRSQEAQTFVRDVRADHDYAIDDYFYGSNREHSKKALKNDVKGMAKQ
jgi:hypothetical protein